MDDLISRQAAIDEIDEWIKAFRENGHKESAADARLIKDGIIQLPSAQPDLDEWCTDCSEYDQERHCCPRWNRVIRQTLKDAQQRGTVVTCGIDKCKHNDDGLCKAESIYLSEDHACDGGCDDGWVFDEKEELKIKGEES